MGLGRNLKKTFSRNRPQRIEESFEERFDFSTNRTDIKPICFYLPQFHRVHENDQWWGNGFTEWTNTRKATPLYRGHYQPRVPHHDIGEYDLSDISVLNRQAKMAKSFGIYGFCFYHYYFSGKKLLEKPVQMLLDNPDIDIPFCLCWANESWTRTWDGLSEEVLIKQAHSPEDDIEFIKDMAVNFRDPRYIRVGGKPLLLVYNVKLLPSPRETSARWRKWCVENGVGEISLAMVAKSGDYRDPQTIGFDWLVEFPPHPIAKTRRLQVLVRKFQGKVHNYKYLVDTVLAERSWCDELRIDRCFRGIMLRWDNSARTGLRANIWENFSFKRYYYWLQYLVRDARIRHTEENRFIFINAWNEWAEGTYLEPDQKHGYRALNTTAKAVFDLDYKGGLGAIPQECAFVSRYGQRYDVVRDIIRSKNSDHSWSLLANKVSPGGDVLEFGPASGHMTRYFKEELGCDVYVVEMDADCAAAAGRYAKDVVVGDIDGMEWAERWAGKQFDVILFADVLEHLIDPWTALRTAVGFLKPGGQLLASIPNLSHNSILIDLWRNRLTYRSSGLFDRTHIRLFSDAAVRAMIRSAGLEIRSIEFTKRSPEDTEFRNSLKELPWMVRRSFRRRQLADVYQFIIDARLPTEA